MWRKIVLGGLLLVTLTCAYGTTDPVEIDAGIADQSVSKPDKAILRDFLSPDYLTNPQKFCEAVVMAVAELAQECLTNIIDFWDYMTRFQEQLDCKYIVEVVRPDQLNECITKIRQTECMAWMLGAVPKECRNQFVYSEEKLPTLPYPFVTK